MALPKKIKYNLDTNPSRSGSEYMKFGLDRIEELMKLTNTKTKYLPRGVGFEDIDTAVFEYVNQEGMSTIIDGDKVPTFYLENDRWGEFSKTWKFMDNDKNVPTPYITVRRTSKEEGTRLDGVRRVPQPRTFRYVDVPILDEGEVIYLRFKMPEPVNVDLEYEISLFTKYRVDVNQYDEQVLRNFASFQEYLFIKGNPMPLKFNGFEESNTVENIDGDRFLTSKYKLLMKGFIQSEDEYEIIKTFRKPKIGYSFDI